MQHVINHLVQLQELTLIREQEAFMGGDRLKELDESIAAYIEQLPPAVRTIFQKLQKKDTVAVVPVTEGACSTCGMMLPTSMIQIVKAKKTVAHCPNCSRILFYTDTAARSVAKKTSRVAPPKVGIDRFSAVELIVPRLNATERDAAIRELAMKMEVAGFVKNPDELVRAALMREAIISTSVDRGLAFPHVRGVEGGGLTMAVGMSTKGIKFDPLERKLTRVIFFMVIPTAANAFYLKLLAGLAETFMEEESRKLLLAETEPEKAWKVLKKLTRKTIP